METKMVNFFFPILKPESTSKYKKTWKDKKIHILAQEDHQNALETRNDREN